MTILYSGVLAGIFLFLLTNSSFKKSREISVVGLHTSEGFCRIVKHLKYKGRPFIFYKKEFLTEETEGKLPEQFNVARQNALDKQRLTIGEEKTKINYLLYVVNLTSFIGVGCLFSYLILKLW